MRHFIQADKSIFYCEGVVTKEGDKVKLSLTDKMVYFHMLDRKKLFTERGGKHFESQSTIARLLFIDTKTAAKSLTKLLNAGLVVGHKESHPSKGYSHWVYTDVNTNPVVYGNEKGVEKDAKALTYNKANNKARTAVEDSLPDWENDPPPF